MAETEMGEVRNTGGQVDEIVMALIDSAYDKDMGVRSVIVTSLKELGRHQPALVLSSCHSYLAKHTKLAQGHRVIVLESMEHIIQDSVDRIDRDLARTIITQASAELTHSKEVVPEWQTAASGVLVALGGAYCHDVMEELQRKFQPGILPHFFVVQTMANLASANVYGMVPFLKVVLGTMLPMMGLAKQDNMRWVFSSALCKFSEAILDYVANIEKAPDPSVTKEFFAPEIDAAYDVIFNVWFTSKEPKLRYVMVEAVGQMAPMLTPDKLELELPRLLPAILALYKRHPTDAYHVTQGLALVLGAAVTKSAATLELQLENLLGALFPQMCQPVDYGSPMTVKNHNELLRCYTILAGPFSDKMITYLLQKVDSSSSSERTRLAAVCVLRHLINSINDQLDDKKQHLMFGLRQLLSDNNNKVKKELAQTIMAMSHHGYLELEGGHQMVKFVIRQCCPVPDPTARRPTDPDYVSDEALRSMFENVLQLMSTTVDNLDTVLWPFILEFLIPVHYTEAVSAVCRCITNVTQSKADDAEPNEPWPSPINYAEHVNVPKPEEVFARLIVLAALPTSGRRRGAHILQALRGLAAHIDSSLIDPWGAAIPDMLHYFEESAEDDGKWSQTYWEDLVIELVVRSLDALSSEVWTIALGEALGHQLALYTGMPQEKKFALTMLGVVISKATDKEFIAKHLDIIFMSVKFSNELEREGCAIAMGHAASSHLDPVLVKLENVARNDGGKRSSGIFSFIKDSVSKSDIDDKLKATLILCYGHVMLHAQRSLVTSRLETTILKAISPHFPNIKKAKDLLKYAQDDMCVKHSLIETTENIGRALHPEHLMTRYTFIQRNELLVHMQNYLKMESPSSVTTQTRALALRACTSLVKLDPILPDLETFELLKTAFECVLPLPPGGSSMQKGKEETYEEVLQKEMLMERTLTSLENLLKELLLKSLTPDGLEIIFRYLHPWSLSPTLHERDRALSLSLKLFQLYYGSINISIGTASHFSNLGSLLGRLVPRCSDPQVTIRQTAIDCVQVIFRIALRYQGHGPDYKDDAVENLSELRERAKKNDPNTMFNVAKDIAQVMGRILPGDQLLPLLEQLYEGLTDQEDMSSSGTSVVLNSIIKSHGGAVPNEVEQMLSALHGRLPNIRCPQTYKGTLRAIRILASHQLLATMTALLNYPLPFDDHLLACWRVISKDKSLVTSMLGHLLELLAKSLPYEERPGFRENDKCVRTATTLPVAVTCVLKEMFGVEEAAEKINDMLPTVLGSVMMRLASTVGVGPPKLVKVADKSKDKVRDKKTRPVSAPYPTKQASLDPCDLAIAALQSLLIATGGQDVVLDLEEEGGWAKFQQEESFPEAFTALARLIVKHQPQHVVKLITVLNPALASIYEPQRVMAAAVLAEFINQKCAGDLALVEMLVNGLLGRLVDPSHIVRRLCIRGLGNVASVGRDQYLQEFHDATIQRHSTTVLSAMMAGMDDKEDLDDLITLEAMSGLSRVLAQIDEAHIRAILINIALRIRPCFEKEKPAVRAAAFTLFGNLSRFGDGPSKAPFLEQIHTNFVSLLLHLHDCDPAVRKACKCALRQLGPLIGSPSINKMFQRHLPEEDVLHYGEFMNDLSKAMISDFPDKLNFYIMGNVTFFRSTWPEIKSNAAMFVGFLLGNAAVEQYEEVSREHICSALIMLLKDPTPEVRIKAAEAMASLHSF